MIVFYDLLGADNRRYSPFCWRTRMALYHKGLPFEVVPVGFTDKDKIAFSGQGLVPVIVDKARNAGGGADKVVCDSWQIACYLDETYPAAPLFASDQARSLSQFLANWSGTTIHAGAAGLIMADLWARVRPQDQAYFRESREKRFGKTLEQVQEGREQRLPAFRASLEPLRMLVRQQPFVSGEQPGYADYIVYGSFQWPRRASDFKLLDDGDPIAAWIGRIDGLYAGELAAARIGPN